MKTELSVFSFSLANGMKIIVFDFDAVYKKYWFLVLILLHSFDDNLSNS